MWVIKFQPSVVGGTIGEIVAYYSSGNTQELLDELESLKDSHSLAANNTAQIRAIENQLFMYKSTVNMDILSTITVFQKEAEEALVRDKKFKVDFSVKENLISNILNS